MRKASLISEHTSCMMGVTDRFSTQPCHLPNLTAVSDNKGRAQEHLPRIGPVLRREFIVRRQLITPVLAVLLHAGTLYDVSDTQRKVRRDRVSHLATVRCRSSQRDWKFSEETQSVTPP